MFSRGFTFIYLFLLVTGCGLSVNSVAGSGSSNGGTPVNETTESVPTRAIMVGGWPGSVINRVFTSTDGENWTSSVTDLPVALSDTCTVALNGILYVIGGYNDVSTVNTVYRSTNNGLNWSLSAMTLPNNVQNAVCTTFNGRVYLFGGAPDNVWTGTNRVYSWNGSETTAWVDEGALLPANIAVAASAKMNGTFYLLGGFNGVGTIDTVYSTTDGLNFVAVGILPISVATSGSAVLNSKIWIAGGDKGGGTVVSTVYSSPDGVNWTNEGDLPAIRRAGGMFNLNDTLYFIGGEEDGSNTNFSDIIFYSTDGVTWNTSGNPLPNANAWFSVATF